MRRSFGVKQDLHPSLFIGKVFLAESAAIKVYGEHEIDAEQPLSVMGKYGTHAWEVYGTPCCPDRNELHTCEADRWLAAFIHVSIRPTDGKIVLLERVIEPRMTFTWVHGTPQDVIYKRASDGGCGGSGGNPFTLGGLCARWSDTAREGRDVQDANQRNSTLPHPLLPKHWEC